MQRISSAAIVGADISEKVIKSAAIRALCPHCRTKVLFSLSGYSPPGPLNSISAQGRCPSCGGEVGFWSLNPNGRHSLEAAEVFISPAAGSLVPDLGEIEEMPLPIRRALLDTVDCYNAGIYSAATASGRRTLEGILRHLLSGEGNGLPLHKLIDAAVVKLDLAAPLKKLSHAIRTGGNLGAHFDEAGEPDETVARQVIDLLTYLVSYLFVLPARIERLEAALVGTPGASEPKG